MEKIALFIHQDSIEVPPDFIKEVIHETKLTQLKPLTSTQGT